MGSNPTASFIVTAVNLINQHWILFFYDRPNKIACKIDPLKLPFKPDIAAKYGAHITNELNAALGENVVFSNKAEFERETQQNGHDCGLFVCIYAMKLSRGEPLEDPDIKMVRDYVRNAGAAPIEQIKGRCCDFTDYSCADSYLSSLVIPADRLKDFANSLAYNKYGVNYQ